MAIKGVNPGELPDYIIVGLGNPGQRYDKTRHNIGFRVIDYLDSQSLTARGCKRMLHHSLVDKCVLDNYVVYLVKPQTYMNNSGLAVQDIMHYYRMKPSQLIVVHDDITLPVGHFKIKRGGSAGGHNGIKSIIEYLKTDDFIHIKVGIGKKPDEWELSNYVLSKFTDNENKVIGDKLPEIKDAVSCIFNYNLEKAMSLYNPIGANKGKTSK